MSGDTVEISLSGEPVPVEVESVQAAPLGPLVAWLKLSEGPAADIPIHEGTVSIGRKSVNTITITNDSYVSGRHAEILTDNTGTYLTDLGSTNGTVVNGERLLPNEPQLLLEGDAVQLGQSKFTFNFAEEEAETSSEAREDVEKPDFA